MTTMYRKLLALLLIVALLVPVVGVSAQAPGAAVNPEATSVVPTFQTETRVATADTYIDGYLPATTHGSERRLWARTDGVEKSLLYFDLSKIDTNQTVVKAWLTLYPLDTRIQNAFTLQLYRGMRGWNESEANWVNATATDMWGAPGADDTSTDRGASPESTATIGANDYSVELDVTSAVNGWVHTPADNMGLILSAASTRNMAREFFSSDEPDANVRPKLTIVYTAFDVNVGDARYQNGADYSGEADTYIKGYSPATNFSGQSKIKVWTGNNEFGLLKFDTSSIPEGAVVANARLKLYTPQLMVAGAQSEVLGNFIDKGEPLTIRAFALLKDWMPTKATWGYATADEKWDVPGALGAGDRVAQPLASTMVPTYRQTWIGLDVTEAAQGWLNGMAAGGGNAGLLIDAVADQSTEFSFASSMYGPDRIHGNVHPVLEITYVTRPPDAVINVVQTNDFHGALTPAKYSWSHNDKVGGLEWIAGYYNILRAKNPGGVLPLDAGDMMQGTLESNYFFGESTIAGLNQVGIMGATFGNHEFDWGIPKLEQRIAQAKFPFVACNIRLKDTNERPAWANPYTYLMVNGVKIGLIGVANPTTGSITNPAFTGNLNFTDPATEVNAIIDEVIAGGATVVIVAAHFGGFSPDYAEITPFMNALDSGKVDLVISGHTHSAIATTINNIPVIQSFSSGSAFGRVDLTIDPWSKMVKSFDVKQPQNAFDTWYGGPATYEGQNVVADPNVIAVVQPFLDQVAALKQTVIGEALAPLTRDYRHESSMGDVITDSWLAFDPTVDFALTNSGGTRADLAQGPITYGALFAVQPFGNTLTKVWLTGSQLRSTLEDGVTGQHGLVQVAGLQFTFNYDLPAHSRIMGDVIDLHTNAPIDPNATYVIFVNNYMASGGDHYMTLPTCTQQNAFAVDIDVLSAYVTAHSPIALPVMGRITTLGTAPAN
jgi:2',3'-cyclic-nucleotide 2'-phosphodiesterase (5'-nucleotidase family)